jgi:uncharacterized iron-regulated protein
MRVGIRFFGRIAALSGAAAALAMLAHGQDERMQARLDEACIAAPAWYTLESGAPRAAPGPEVLARIAQRDIVLLGEQHDDPSHHQWQLQTLAALLQLRPRMVIGFESFPRRVQAVLDRWVAGDLTERQFLEQSEWPKVWRFPAELYLPLFHFARMNRVPMVALNVDRSVTEAITRSGWDAVPDSQKEGIGRPAQPSTAYTDYLFEIFRHHERVADRPTAGLGKDAAEFRFFVEAQTTWDRAMAEALARALGGSAEGERPLVVGVMGNGHVRGGFGVAHQLRDIGVGNVGTLLPVDPQRDCASFKPGLADALFAVPRLALDKPPPPRLGVRLEEVDGGVQLAEVTAASLAERSGLQRGDRIVSVAGAPVTRAGNVVAAVRLQPAGTWLPLQIRRGEETLELVVKFPPLQ